MASRVKQKKNQYLDNLQKKSPYQFLIGAKQNKSESLYMSVTYCDETETEHVSHSSEIVKRGTWDYIWLLAFALVKRGLGLHLASLCHTYLTESARVAAVMRLSPQSAT